MSKHIPTKAQEKAFASVVRAIERANKAGLVIYAKSWSLTAYTKEADAYAEKYSPLHNIGSYGTIPYLSATCLADSGADDYACYISEKDEEKFDPYSSLND